MSRKREARPLPLKAIEAAAIEGLEALRREIERDVIAPFNQKRAEVDRIIEKRLKLPEGAIGSTHQIDLSRAALIEIPKEERKPSS